MKLEQSVKQVYFIKDSLHSCGIRAISTCIFMQTILLSHVQLCFVFVHSYMHIYLNGTFRRVEHGYQDILPRLRHSPSLEVLRSHLLQNLECLLVLCTPLWRKVDDLHHIQRNTTWDGDSTSDENIL